MAKFTKEVNLVAPFINMKKGLVIQAKILAHEEVDPFEKNAEGKKDKVLEIELLSAFTNPPKPKSKDDKETKHKAGDVLRLSLKAGNQRMYSLPVGTEFQLTVVGQVASSKGNDAWTFDLKLAE